MNWLMFASGIAALATTIGHFLLGSRDYLSPVLDASLDTVPKKVMLSVFHYISVFLILSTMALFAIALGIVTDSQPSLIVRFVALNYLGFAIAQVTVALNSGIERAITKMFQWVFFSIVAVLAWLGA